MKYLDCTFPTPAENLAWEEAYLDQCEAGSADELLRFYESPKPFVVLGYANKAHSEVDVGMCLEQHVGVFRRISGGGTVLQGPGCLSYALFLRIGARHELSSITGTNQFIMEQNRSTLAKLTQLPVQVQGHTDLAIEARKFSGNAQRRKKSFVLFHGTVMFAMDIPSISQFLRMPSLEPEYRSGRRHEDFLMNLPVSRSSIQESFRAKWDAGAILTNPIPRVAQDLMDTYNSNEWIYRAEES